jgi:hypothetical protein
MARTLPYRVSKRRCWFVSPSRIDARGHVAYTVEAHVKEYAMLKCKGSPIMWPKMSLTALNTPLCEAHARHFYGDPHVDELITCGAIKVWKLSKENGTVQPALTVAKGATNEWQNLSR